MTSNTTVRRGDHKATNQRAGTVQKASEQPETTPGQGERGKVERAKAEIEQVTSGRGLPMGLKLPGGTKGNLIWWGSLAALAAFEIVDWPVAAVVAAGTWIAEQHVRQRRQLVGAETAS